MLKKKLKRIIGSIYHCSLGRLHQKIGNRTLIYHAFGSRLSHDFYGISIKPQSFEQHIRFIKDNYEPLPADMIGRQLDFEKRTVTITIDDGYEDTMRAADILQKYNFPFALFITTGLVGKKQYLSEKQIQELSGLENCIIGTHCVEHVKLSTLSEKEQNYQLKKSKKDIERIIQKKVYMMSLPHGDFSEETLQLIRSNGYRLNFTSRIGQNLNKDYDPYLIKRSEIIASDTILDLREKISGNYDYLAFVHKLKNGYS